MEGMLKVGGGKFLMEGTLKFENGTSMLFRSSESKKV